MLVEYTHHLRAAKCCESTINLRLYYVSRAQADGLNLRACKTAELEAWIAGQEWSVETARSARSSLAVFFDWFHRSGGREDNPARELPVISELPPCPRPLPEVAYRRAVLEARGVDRLALRLAGEAGLRRSEVARIHIDDVEQDLLGVSLRVHGKGGKVRLVPLSSSLARELEAALEASPYAFPSPVTDGHLTAGCIGKRVAALLPAGYSMHSLRHRFATVAYSRSSDIRAVQELLGHASLATTQRYVATSAARLRQVAALAA